VLTRPKASSASRGPASVGLLVDVICCPAAVASCVGSPRCTRSGARSRVCHRHPVWLPARPNRHGGRRSARPVALCLETASNPPTGSAPRWGCALLPATCPASNPPPPTSTSPAHPVPPHRGSSTAAGDHVEAGPPQQHPVEYPHGTPPLGQDQAQALDPHRGGDAGRTAVPASRADGGLGRSRSRSGPIPLDGLMSKVIPSRATLMERTRRPWRPARRNDAVPAGRRPRWSECNRTTARSSTAVPAARPTYPSASSVKSHNENVSAARTARSARTMSVSVFGRPISGQAHTRVSSPSGGSGVSQ
jgi:hypothetical protein